MSIESSLSVPSDPSSPFVPPVPSPITPITQMEAEEMEMATGEPIEVLGFPIPRLVRLHMLHGEVIQGADLYIGRAWRRGGWDLPKSDWANPFSAQSLGREAAVREYRKYILRKFIGDPWTWAERVKTITQAHTIGCWCAPEPCHGDVLIEFLSRYFLREREITPSGVMTLAKEMLAEVR